MIVGEVFFDRSMHQFVLEKVGLVEEQDDRSGQKPLRVANRFEKHQCFLHLVLQALRQPKKRAREFSDSPEAYRVLVFHETLIVTGDCHQEKQRSNVFKAVDPLLSLRPLTADVEHPVAERAQVKHGLSNSGCLEA